MFGWAGLACLACTAQAQAIRVLKLSDGKPSQMGKVNAVRVVHPDMGAKRSPRLASARSHPGPHAAGRRAYQFKSPVRGLLTQYTSLAANQRASAGRSRTRATTH
jgi:hypothetical protein